VHSYIVDSFAGSGVLLYIGSLWADQKILLLAVVQIFIPMDVCFNKLLHSSGCFCVPSMIQHFYCHVAACLAVKTQYKNIDLG
jgi:hypothetical protein